MDSCINCGIATSHCNASGRHPLNEENILSVVRAWVAPRTVNPSHHLCKACWDLAIDMFLSHESLDDIPAFRGHVNVCIHCGCSLRRTRFHRLESNTERDKRILNVISEWILPRIVEARSAICHSCWVRAGRAARHAVSQSSTSASVSDMDTSAINTSNLLRSMLESPTSEIPVFDLSTLTEETNKPADVTSQDSIVLPDYLRPIQTESKCFVVGCKRRERNRVPTSLRINLLNKHNYYVPHNNRICDNHINQPVETLHLLIGPSNKSANTFTASHIQDMLALKSHQVIYDSLVPTTSSASIS